MIGCDVIQNLKCPVCDAGLEITAVACTCCHLEIRGSIRPHWLIGLDSEILDFLLTFIRCRGVIRDIEALLGVSYPTVRNRIDQLVDAVEQRLEESQSVVAPPDSRIAILNRLAGGQISPERAMALLDALMHP
jgi:hypothetical protein